MTSAAAVAATEATSALDRETHKDPSSEAPKDLPLLPPLHDILVAASVEGTEVPSEAETRGSAMTGGTSSMASTSSVASASKPGTKDRAPLGKPHPPTATSTPQKSADLGTKVARTRFPPPPPKTIKTPAGSTRTTRTTGRTPRTTQQQRHGVGATGTVSSSRYGLRSASASRTGARGSNFSSTSGSTAAGSTPLRKNSADGGAAAAPTPREAAIRAKKQLTERKQREAALHKRQQEEIKRAALAKQAEQQAERQRSLQERQKTGQRQRLATAAAKQAAREKKADELAQELKAKMEESKELQDNLRMQERVRRRISMDYRNADWGKVRELKKRQQESMHEEQRIIIEGHDMFREAKDKVRQEEAHEAKLERTWRARQGHLHKSLNMGMAGVAAYEACELRRARAEDQTALEAAAQDENRRRRESAQWARNKRHLENEIARGMGKSLDPLKLAEELYWREEGRKEERQYKETQKALRRQSMARRRMSDIRRATVEAAMRERDRQKEADMKASEEAGMQDMKTYREACLRRQRESLAGRRKVKMEEKAMDQVWEELSLEIESEERLLSELVRADIEAHTEELAAMEKAEEDFRRREMIRERQLKQYSVLKQKKEEAEDRRILMADRNSVAESKRRHDKEELARLEALRELPSEKTKLDILEAIWQRQIHPAAAAAARGRNQKELRTVQEGVGEEDSFELNNSSVISSSSGSSSSSGMGIKGRVSVAASLDSILAGVGESESDSDNDCDREKYGLKKAGGGDPRGIVVGDVGDLVVGDHRKGEPGGLDCSAVSFMSESQVGLVGNVRLAEEEDQDQGQPEEKDDRCDELRDVSEGLGWGDVSFAAIGDEDYDEHPSLDVDVPLDITGSIADDAVAVAVGSGAVEPGRPSLTAVEVDDDDTSKHDAGVAPGGEQHAEQEEDTVDVSAVLGGATHTDVERDGERSDAGVVIDGSMPRGADGGDTGASPQGEIGADDISAGGVSSSAASAPTWGEEVSVIEMQASSLSMTTKEGREQEEERGLVSEAEAAQGESFVADGESFADDSAIAAEEDGDGANEAAVGNRPRSVVRMLTFSPNKHARVNDDVMSQEGEGVHDGQSQASLSSSPTRTNIKLLQSTGSDAEQHHCTEGTTEEEGQDLEASAALQGARRTGLLTGGSNGVTGDDSDRILMLSRSAMDQRVAEVSYDDETNGAPGGRSPTESLESLEENRTLASLDENDATSVMSSVLNVSAMGGGVDKEVGVVEAHGDKDVVGDRMVGVAGGAMVTTPSKAGSFDADRVAAVGFVVAVPPATPVTPDDD